ncbi:MAG: hypothetical protein HY656_09545 [Acidobacteria bacterium]|nr:hypothetical protein [Acidobacteriota bacterium]
MRRILLAGALLVGVAAVAAAQSSSEARAAAVVDEMMNAMGGQESWEKMRYLRFDWVVERDGKEAAHVRHLWDRYQGHYRLEWTSREGTKLAALFNVNTRSGRVLVNGEPARDEDEQKYLDQAYGRFINDSYWLLMPWKLKDPGVKLEYAGETQLDGQSYDLIHVSFAQVGLTPGDHYWAYVNRRTRLMERWAYFLQSYEGTPAVEKATPWQWQSWADVGGGLHLAREKVRVGENMRIYFPLLEVLPGVEPTAFESFESPMPGPPPAGE